MALGGGTYTIQDKVLPGSYINFVSLANAPGALGERGTAAVPMTLSWGPLGEVFAVTRKQFSTVAQKLFGYSAKSDELRPVRELFLGANKVLFYRLGTGGTAASNTFATAKYPGARGNAIKIVIESAGTNIFNVSTYLGAELMDRQKGVAGSASEYDSTATYAVGVCCLHDGGVYRCSTAISTAEAWTSGHWTLVENAAVLKDNAFVTWKKAALSVNAGLAMTSGADPTLDTTNYTDYDTCFEKLQPYHFQAIGVATTVAAVKAKVAAFTQQMREDYGVKFQAVLFRYESADYEGVISVETGLASAASDPSLVYWVTGAEAGCGLGASLTNALYPGEYAPDLDVTQQELVSARQSGKLIFHRVGDDARVLADINTLTTFTEAKGEGFSQNSTMRTLDQIGNDIAALFNTRYIGTPNDNAGRIALWSDIVKHHQALATARAIEDFEPEDVTVEPGEDRYSVTVTDYVLPTGVLEKLYMTVIVR